MQRRTSRALSLCTALVVVIVGTVSCTTTPPLPPPPANAAYRNPGLPAAVRARDLLSYLTLDEKLGQMMLVERGSAAHGEVASLGLGGVFSAPGALAGSNSATVWADTYEALEHERARTRLAIPLLKAADAVHGHGSVAGATLFPHNIGLGATRDPMLVEQIGRATAEEVAGTGLNWTFAPCVCVARNDRWGRTYESFGEVPDLVSSMTSVITGLQGDAVGAGDPSVLATAKHYLADGGTSGGEDRGNAAITEDELRAVHLPSFRAAVARDVGAVMLSYSSWNGVEVHAHRYLVTDVLKGELGFDGIVVSDYGGVDDIDGFPLFTADEVVAAIDAGVDMVLGPWSPALFIGFARDAVNAGRIPISRIDDAVLRILTRKFQLGLFERPLPDRALLDTVGSAAHRDLARRAVQESLVLLKNAGGVLPLSPSSRVFVAGKAADDIGYQSGGWTITWQGGGGPVTEGTTILEGIRQTATDPAHVTYDREGDGVDATYDAAIAVVGETPYAEFVGDRRGQMRLDAEDGATLARLRGAGIPVIVVLVSGRPLTITDELPGWSALVAVWLPGTEGGGVSDVLFGLRRPTGTLPVTWPIDERQQPINAGDGTAGLFPYGFGLTYP